MTQRPRPLASLLGDLTTRGESTRSSCRVGNDPGCSSPSHPATWSSPRAVPDCPVRACASQEHSSVVSPGGSGVASSSSREWSSPASGRVAGPARTKDAVLPDPWPARHIQGNTHEHPPNRSNEMNLMHEELARAQMSERLGEAQVAAWPVGRPPPSLESQGGAGRSAGPAGPGPRSVRHSSFVEDVAP